MALVNDMIALFDRLEATHMPKIEAALLDAMQQSMANIRRTHLPGQIDGAERQAIASALGALWGDAARNSADMIVDHFASEFKRMQRKAAQDAAVLRIISEYVSGWGRNRANQVIQTTEKQMLDMVRGGMARGEAQEVLFASIIGKIPDLAAARSFIVTRTEAHTASQFASQRMAEAAGIRLRKIWHSVVDDRTRRFGLFGRMDEFNHLVMNGAKVDLQDAFSVPRRTGGFERLPFPGHPAGSAANVINCRCVQTYEAV